MRVALSLLTALCGYLALASAAATFSYGFQISNLVVDSPFQSNLSSTTNSTVSFDFFDQDTPTVSAAHCLCEWNVGLTPNLGTSACDNSSYRFTIPAETYRGVQNFTINLRHNYRDDSLGAFPYNSNTKIGVLSLTYPSTMYYECDLAHANCNSCEETVLNANVTESIAK